MPESIINALTIDVEDYFHVNAFADRIPRGEWDCYPSRVVANTHRILRILEHSQVRATFFVLGWVADRFPGLVREIRKAGHEIGCHSYWHRLVYQLTPEEFRADLVRAGQAIQEVLGERLRAYRAPSFSITRKSLWALDVLLDEGYDRDSSVFPVRHDCYGIPDAPRSPHSIRRPRGTLVGFPPAVYRLWRFNLPVAGGGYFRLCPARWSLYWLRRISEESREPFMFYIHPWELDPDQPRLPGRLRSRFRHYQNLRSTEDKFRRLLEAFRWGTMHDALATSRSVLAEPWDAEPASRWNRVERARSVSG
ncbi:MAG: XrtA system polysaccharide deacetylase [Planctomycetaceae bacterium]